MKKFFVLLASAVLAAVTAAPVPQDQKPSSYKFDLTGKGLKKLSSGAWLWKIPASKEQQKIVFDLDALKIMPNDYDEIRVLMKNTKANSGLMVRITDYPSKDQLRSWYSKTDIPQNKVTDLRFDLRLDDDGWWHGTKPRDGRKLEISLIKKYRRTPGEPPDRETEIYAIELIRRSADISFDEIKATLETTW